MQDINGNFSEVYFDVLGLPTAMAVKGKGSEGDNLTGFTYALANPESDHLAAFFDQANLDEAQTRIWLGSNARIQAMSSPCPRWKNCSARWITATAGTAGPSCRSPLI